MLRVPAAYDALSQLHDRNANDGDAKTVLRMALEVSPNAVHRHKAIGTIALRSKISRPRRPRSARSCARVETDLRAARMIT